MPPPPKPAVVVVPKPVPELVPAADVLLKLKLGLLVCCPKRDEPVVLPKPVVPVPKPPVFWEVPKIPPDGCEEVVGLEPKMPPVAGLFPNILFVPLLNPPPDWP
jgi:hypothetical protein